jgi:hypothetical protein
MKVRTNLSSGNVVNDASQEVSKAFNQITEFVSEAGMEADKITSGLTNSLNCIKNSFNL